MARDNGNEPGTGIRFLGLALALASSALLMAGLSGCAPSVSIRPPAATDIERVKDRQLAVALFRISTSIDGKPLSPSNPGDSNNTLRIYLASLDDMGAPTRVAPASFSESMAAEGWNYLMLPPGVYYMLALPPGVEQNPPAVAYHAAGARFGRLTQYRFDPGRGGFWSPELMAFVLAKEPPSDFQELQCSLASTGFPARLVQSTTPRDSFQRSSKPPVLTELRSNLTADIGVRMRPRARTCATG